MNNQCARKNSAPACGLLVGMACICLLLSSCRKATDTPSAQPPPASSPSVSGSLASATTVVLRVEGPSGAKSLSLNDIKALPATEGWAGVKAHAGKVFGPDRYKGVAVADRAGGTAD